MLSKSVTDIQSISIKRLDTDAVLASNLVDYTTGNTGLKKFQLTFTEDTEFEITVTDKLGNVITATDTVTYSVNRVTIEEFNIDPTQWYQLPAGNVANITLNWVLSHAKEHVVDVMLHQNILNDSWGEGTSVYDSTNEDGTGSIILPSVPITSNKLYRLVVTSLSGSPDSKEVGLTYIPYIPVMFTSDPAISPNSSGGGIDNYTFSAVISKMKENMGAGSYVRLYETDNAGNEVQAGVENVLNSFLSPGQNYVDMWSYLTVSNVSRTMLLTINKTSYFKMVVCEIDSLGNTSTDDGELMSVSYAPEITILSFSHTPTTYYVYDGVDDSFIMSLVAQFSEAFTQERLDNTENLQLRVQSGINTYDIDLLSTAISVGSAGLSDTIILNQASTYQFRDPGTYNLRLVFKEVGVEEVLSLQSSFIAQEKVGISSLTIQRSGANYVVSAILNKLLLITSTIELEEREVGGTYSEVTNTITRTTVTNNQGVSVTKISFNTSLVGEGSDFSYQLKITENIGAIGLNATSEDEETYEWTIAANVYWGILSDAVLQTLGYTIDFGGGILGDPTKNSSSLLTYGLSPVGDHDIMDVIFTSSLFTYSSLNPTEQVEAMTASSSGNGYFVDGTDKNYLKFNFADRFGVLGIDTGFMWMVIPEGGGFPLFEHWYQAAGGVLEINEGRWFVIEHVTVNGNLSTLYAFRGRIDLATGPEYMGNALAQVINLKLKHEI